MLHTRRSPIPVIALAARGYRRKLQCVSPHIQFNLVYGTRSGDTKGLTATYGRQADEMGFWTRVREKNDGVCIIQIFWIPAMCGPSWSVYLDMNQ